MEANQFCLRCGKRLDEGDFGEGICLICGEPIATVGESTDEENTAASPPPPKEIEWIEDGDYAVCPLCQASYNLDEVPPQCDRCAQDPEFSQTRWILREKNPNMYLLYSDGNERIALTDGLVLGRGSTSCLANDRYVSRRHALISIRNGHVLIADENSDNGTWVNDRQLLPGSFYLLHEGDTLRLDKQCFLVERELRN